MNSSVPDGERRATNRMVLAHKHRVARKRVMRRVGYLALYLVVTIATSMPPLFLAGLLLLNVGFLAPGGGSMFWSIASIAIAIIAMSSVWMWAAYFFDRHARRKLPRF